MASAKVPITLLTGFLGSGKTSRLNTTLVGGSLKIAVIENELGAIGVDGSLVANTHDDGVIELANGCLCCSAEIDLIGALEALASRRASRPFDHVVIETTGLADVSPVVSLLRDRDDALAEDFIFNGVVTIVDAACFSRWRHSRVVGNGVPLIPRGSGFGSLAMEASSGPEFSPGRNATIGVFWRQLALADCILISKTDLASVEGMSEMQDVIASVNPFADLAVHAASNPLPLTNLRPSSSNQSIHDSQGQQNSEIGVKRFCGTRSRMPRAMHLEGVDIITLRFTADVRFLPDSLKSFLSRLLAGDLHHNGVAMDAWRVKGIVPCTGLGTTLVQGVGDQVELEAWPHSSQVESFLVVIGEHLHSEHIEKALIAISDTASAADLAEESCTAR